MSVRRRDDIGPRGAIPGLVLGLVAVASLIACRLPEASDQAAPAEDRAPLFEDVTVQSGIDFTHRNGATGRFYYPELLQGGVGFLDFDGDSFLDAYLVQAGPLPADAHSEAGANRLYRNRGDGTFEDVTTQSGTGNRGYGSGVAAADYDGDGWVDLYVTNLGPNALYRNNGDGTFSDVTDEAGVGDPGYSTSATFLDFDRDGDLDLFVCNYIDWSPRVERPCLGPHGQRGYCSPLEYERPQPDRLYSNEGGGRFRDVSAEAGIARAKGTGLGVAAADFDGDGWTDVYVANDQMPNHLWINRADGTFSEEALVRGCALSEAGLPEASMGVATGDFDDDGDWDLFLTHLSGETNTFYLNEGGHFRDVTDELHLGWVSMAFTGFGTALFDFDNDSVLDIFIANGKVRPGDSMEVDYAEPNQLLHGGTDRHFEDVSKLAGAAFLLREVSRGTAFGDYDLDGDVDLLLVNNQGPARLLRNEVGNRRHWLAVQLEGAPPNRQGLGARVSALVGKRQLHRLVQPGYSYCSTNDSKVWFGLGEHDVVDELTVFWPRGARQVLRDVPADQFLRLEAPPPADESRTAAAGLPVRRRTDGTTPGSGRGRSRVESAPLRLPGSREHRGSDDS